MHRPKGFTLIELLVVIAIIALLMAILMPALQRVKKQAQEVKCRAYLKQWGLIFAMYTEDNDNKFMSTGAGLWVNPLRPYYKNGGEAMRTCPTATKTAEEGASPVFAAWDLVTKPYDKPHMRRELTEGELTKLQATADRRMKAQWRVEGGALKLRHPTTIEAQGPVHAESAAKWTIARQEYPARCVLPPVTLTWYNGGG